VHEGTIEKMNHVKFHRYLITSYGLAERYIYFSEKNKKEKIDIIDSKDISATITEFSINDR